MSELAAPPPSEPWTQIPNEPSNRFAAFRIFRDLGPTRTLVDAEIGFRTVHGTSDQVTKLRVTRSVSPTFHRWARQHGWVERATAYDNYLDAKELELMRRERVKAASRHAKAAAKLSSVLSRPVDLMAERIEQVLKNARVDDLDKLNDAELAELVRSSARPILDAQKGERDALSISEVAPTDNTRIVARGELVRRMLESPEARAVLERVSLEVSSEPVTPDKPTH